jgi:hypothetical protein
MIDGKTGLEVSFGLLEGKLSSCSREIELLLEILVVLCISKRIRKKMNITSVTSR